jgi:short-subunit dehydrogenase
MKVTKLVIPGMVSRKRGLILTVGSFASLIPSPLLAVYSGSKAFLSTWSQALGRELKGTGVEVELLNTYFVVHPVAFSSLYAGPNRPGLAGLEAEQDPQELVDDPDAQDLRP